jgi:hypothetical protein
MGRRRSNTGGGGGVEHRCCFSRASRWRRLKLASLVEISEDFSCCGIRVAGTAWSSSSSSREGSGELGGELKSEACVPADNTDEHDDDE